MKQAISKPEATESHAEATTGPPAARRGDWVGLVVLAAFSGLTGYLAASSVQSADTPNNKADTRRAAPRVDRPADSALSPSEVVNEQMKALTACRLNRGAAARVFAFASPANKAVTGPVERFEKMIWAPPFDILICNEGWSVGSAVEREGVATALVLVVQPGGGTIAFRFYLSWVSDADAAGRWMTDAVLPLQKSAPASDDEDQDDEGVVSRPRRPPPSGAALRLTQLPS